MKAKHSKGSSCYLIQPKPGFYPLLARLTLIAMLLGCAPASRAQWLTQTNSLKAGWNAVFLHVDASYTNVTALLQATDPDHAIQEIWMWNSDLPPGQSVASPISPPGSQWSSWSYVAGHASVLELLRGNSSLLVRVADSVASFEWRLPGRPVAPLYRWTLTGLNFIGFPAVVPPPSFRSFMDPDAQPLNWVEDSEIFRYPGGNLSANNPVLVNLADPRDATPVRRDQAYWVRAGELTNQFYNRYFGPFQVRGSDASGICFGENVGQVRLYLKNMSVSPITVTLSQVPSDPSPHNQKPIAGMLPLLIRGSLNTTNLSFGYTNLALGSCLWALKPHGQVGSEAEVILGLDRSQMAAVPGAEFAGVLRFADSLGLSRIDIGASAATPSKVGLWVGSASVGSVSRYVKTYAVATNAEAFTNLLVRLGRAEGANGYHYEWHTNSGRVLVFDGPETNKGSYLLDGPIQVEQASVARPFPLRLIIHNDGTTAKLLQRVYLGHDASSHILVAVSEGAIPVSKLAFARRVSAVHLPTMDESGPWNFSGTMHEGAMLTATVTLPYNDHSSSPFLHTYHPDHDNKDPAFALDLQSGKESYEVRRNISLQFAAPANDFESLTRSGASLTGNYGETVTFRGPKGDLKTFDVLGSFQLTRITDVATLTP